MIFCSFLFSTIFHFFLFYFSIKKEKILPRHPIQYSIQNRIENEPNTLWVTHSSYLHQHHVWALTVGRWGRVRACFILPNIDDRVCVSYMPALNYKPTQLHHLSTIQSWNRDKIDPGVVCMTHSLVWQLSVSLWQKLCCITLCLLLWLRQRNKSEMNDWQDNGAVGWSRNLPDPV